MFERYILLWFQFRSSRGEGRWARGRHSGAGGWSPEGARGGRVSSAQFSEGGMGGVRFPGMGGAIISKGA